MTDTLIIRFDQVRGILRSMFSTIGLLWWPSSSSSSDSPPLPSCHFDLTCYYSGLYVDDLTEEEDDVRRRWELAGKEFAFLVLQEEQVLGQRPGVD
jgi:hypothetical protein